MDENEPRPKDLEEEPHSEEEPPPEKEERRNRAAEIEEAWQPKLWSKIILLIVFVGYGLALIVANSSKVDISFLFASVKITKIVLILVCVAIGLVTGVLISQMSRHRGMKRARLEEQAAQSKDQRQ
jgi:uncharacterized integral membrane protein